MRAPPWCTVVAWNVSAAKKAVQQLNRTQAVTWPWNICSGRDQKPWNKVMQSWKHWPSHSLMASNLLEQPLKSPTQRPPICHCCEHSSTPYWNNQAAWELAPRDQTPAQTPHKPKGTSPCAEYDNCAPSLACYMCSYQPKRLKNRISIYWKFQYFKVGGFNSKIILKGRSKSEQWNKWYRNF